MNKYCTKCGRQVFPSENHCRGCGDWTVYASYINPDPELRTAEEIDAHVEWLYTRSGYWTREQVLEDGTIVPPRYILSDPIKKSANGTGLYTFVGGFILAIIILAAEPAGNPTLNSMSVAVLWSVLALVTARKLLIWRDDINISLDEEGAGWFWVVVMGLAALGALYFIAAGYRMPDSSVWTA
jgi:tetrahydromethanopterin S-methyltransferase subunit F